MSRGYGVGQSHFGEELARVVGLYETYNLPMSSPPLYPVEMQEDELTDI